MYTHYADAFEKSHTLHKVKVSDVWPFILDNMLSHVRAGDINGVTLAVLENNKLY